MRNLHSIFIPDSQIHYQQMSQYNAKEETKQESQER